MKKIIGIIFLVALLAGCASLGPKYSELKIDIIPPDKARIVVFRTEDSELYRMRDAPIIIDERRIGTCPFGSFIYSDVSEGQHTIKTETWDMPGKCEAVITVKSGQVYYFLVDPRTASFFATVAGGGIIGNVIEASGKKCAGAFSLYAVDEETAKSKLVELKLNN